jgi:hypothetical protein
MKRRRIRRRGRRRRGRRRRRRETINTFATAYNSVILPLSSDANVPPLPSGKINSVWPHQLNCLTTYVGKNDICVHSQKTRIKEMTFPLV